MTKKTTKAAPAAATVIFPKVENGRRAVVEFGNYTGTAGISGAGDKLKVAFAGSPRDLIGVEQGTIDDVPHKVISLAASPFVKGRDKKMTLLAVERIAEAPAGA